MEPSVDRTAAPFLSLPVLPVLAFASTSERRVRLPPLARSKSRTAPANRICAPVLEISTAALLGTLIVSVMAISAVTTMGSVYESTAALRASKVATSTALVQMKRFARATKHQIFPRWKMHREPAMARFGSSDILTRRGRWRPRDMLAKGAGSKARAICHDDN